jgi:hypothetical protein
LERLTPTGSRRLDPFLSKTAPKSLVEKTEFDSQKLAKADSKAIPVNVPRYRTPDPRKNTKVMEAMSEEKKNVVKKPSDLAAKIRPTSVEHR